MRSTGNQNCAARSDLQVKKSPVTLVLTLVAFVQGDCGRPQKIQFAELSNKHVGTDTFPVGSFVTYHCQPGYVKIPGKSASLRCLPDSKWSKAEELCHPRSCGNPGELHHGSVEVNGTTFGSVAVFRCDIGYNMLSRPHRKCLETGSWSNMVPICEPVICESPPNSPNAVRSRMEEDDFTYLSSVTYHCTAGMLDGEGSIYCTHHGNWSGPAPECIDVSCPMPSVNNAALISGFGTHFIYGHVLTFQCREGFVMNGSSVLYCGRDGAWLPEKPVCKRRASCPEPEVANGNIIFGNKETFQSGLETGYRVSTFVTFRCDPSFYLSGSEKIQCQTNRQWKPTKPNCVAKIDPQSSAVVPHTAGGSNVLQVAAVGEGGTTTHCPTRFLPAGKQSITCTGGSTADPKDTVSNNRMS
ncbi:hypothetical protein NDU88_004716 [Pleurodeles waltl]|uniref:Sushi domain-containing protein n=1 Tax=Pleurodeles waltl TaxID=8319 RepID=A0AAV7QDB2_PLEWA|nr:hypothetical protein NDU88_004716 [Pleurodeles waltl]